ncbi:MAG: saccharopine dehydrogenase NADP-binding domain-containing protein [Bacteroidales bacterium]|nr:saccharopine dehydrogenase NADP-binding domain-containing protein [Bacteroidales bacterium]
MKNILILGAGLSASTMIRYLLESGKTNGWTVTITSRSIQKSQEKIGHYSNGIPETYEIGDDKKLQELISKADVVVSMLPARYHPIVARHCLSMKKHLFTTSYVSPEMLALDQEARSKGLLFLNECGVDPGIDHMSAMKKIHEIRNKGGKVIGFMSNTGGLIAPEYDNNPWHYKFTWNPRNVVLAGQAGGRYLWHGEYKYIPYHRLFERIEITEVLDYGKFEIYANRDSLNYISVYGLEGIETIFRGTFRRPGYCEAWNKFVQLGITDDSYEIENPDKLTYRSFIRAFLPYRSNLSVEDNFCQYLGINRESETYKKFEWLGIFEEKPVPTGCKTPAQILQALLEEKWKLEEHDLDMIVMQHTFDYVLDGKKKRELSSMVIIGRNTVDTAMSITVGMPLAIAIELFLTNKIQATGVKIPVTPDLYEPILERLVDWNVRFIDEEVPYQD